MLCPHCQHDIAELWQEFYANTDSVGDKADPYQMVRGRGDVYGVDWMECHNSSCRKIIIRVEQRGPDKDPNGNSIRRHWYAVPRKAAPRPIDPLVDARYADDYSEASLILDDSPQASAMLSRRVLADVLRTVGGYKQRNLEDQIDAFINDSHPHGLKENLHYLREIGNFGAHTQEDSTDGTVIKVERPEAEWTLDVLDRLFEYWIVEPARSEKMRAEMAAKLERAGRKPIQPLPDPRGNDVRT